jgi:hypothetical protein
MSGEKTCIDMKNIPDRSAVSDTDQSNYGDANFGILNIDLVAKENNHIRLALFQRSSLLAYPLKSEVPYK